MSHPVESSTTVYGEISYNKSPCREFNYTPNHPQLETSHPLGTDIMQLETSHPVERSARNIYRIFIYLLTSHPVERSAIYLFIPTQ